MNLFKQYGIKEVADVMFYSITRIGDEEFFTPVMYLDTLKISSVDKKINNVSAFGGKGNGKILAWNFDKGTTLKFEDALFSQQSLDMFMNGRVMAKLSDWTSAIAKLSVANKYGQKHYSIKAFPSPELTDAEWEIVYRCAEKAGYDPRTGETFLAGTNTANKGRINHATRYVFNTKDGDTDVDGMVAENRWLLKKGYTDRKQKTPHPRDIARFIDTNDEEYSGVSLILTPTLNGETEDSLFYEYEKAQEFKKMNVGDIISGNMALTLVYEDKQAQTETQVIKHGDIDKNGKQISLLLHYVIKLNTDGYHCISANFESDIDIIKSIFPCFNSQITETIKIQIGNDFFLKHIVYYLFPNYLEEVLGDLCWCDLNGISYTAMPPQIIEQISNEIKSFKQIGHFSNDLSEAKTIDRFEKCVVTDQKGLKIDLINQFKNIQKKNENVFDNYSIFFDVKTLMPFLKKGEVTKQMFEQKCARLIGQTNQQPTKQQMITAIKDYLSNTYNSTWINNLQDDDYVINRVESITEPKIANTVYLIYFVITKKEYLVLKPGTIYYKFSRTVDTDVNNLTYLGTNLSIDEDTLSGEYLIVGETFIREQQTGVDQRCQIVINRAKISSSTKLNLQAGGSPLTFSVDVDALVPRDKNKSTMELHMYNVEQDGIEGGYKIIPQNKHHVTTPFMQSREEIIANNVELY